jgi:hypothetical protein
MEFHAATSSSLYCHWYVNVTSVAVAATPSTPFFVGTTTTEYVDPSVTGFTATDADVENSTSSLRHDCVAVAPVTVSAKVMAVDDAPPAAAACLKSLLKMPMPILPVM